MKRQEEFQEKLMIAIPLALTILAVIGLFVYMYVKSSGGAL